MTVTKDLTKSLLKSNNIIFHFSDYSSFFGFSKYTTHDSQYTYTKTINKLSSSRRYKFGTINNDIPVKIVNYLDLNILSNQMCVRL